ncbi:hypothetical protein D3D02_05760 [Halobellus sp. Atlit-38R]|jgi:hypothetical protein|uniref:hypothetical protein n=1 Tax=Halobellus sp. Atlit-38R TaxID=2282131 RepID=UPI000EF1BCB6|nr:hypothetical protein [Halobellus sp. Atlit-38R]RLM90268.1 hypothetical protein D3D02_05760 [Halobellus sp. Atlit-38R]
MDALRIERLAWAGIFAAVVAVVVTTVLAPDPTGLLPLGVALGTFAVVAPLAAWFALDSISPEAEAGDQTVQYLVFFGVALGGRLALGALGIGGPVGGIVPLAVGWLVATQAKGLNPRRWTGGSRA